MKIKLVTAQNYRKLMANLKGKTATRLINISDSRIENVETNSKLIPKEIIRANTTPSDYVQAYKSQLKGLNSNKVLKTLKAKKGVTILIINPFLKSITSEFLGLDKDPKRIFDEKSI